MVDALLINPRVSVNEKYPPLSLINLAAYAEREGYSVDICDAAAFEMSDEDVLDIISQCNPMCVGLTFESISLKCCLLLVFIVVPFSLRLVGEKELRYVGNIFVKVREPI